MKKLSFLLMAMLFSVMSFAQTTVTKTTTDLVTEHSWTVSAGSTIGTLATEFALDEVVTISTSGEANCGTIWGTAPNNDYRLYQNKAGDITITVKSGYQLKTINLTYTINNNGTLLDGITTVASGTDLDVTGLTSKTLVVGNTGSKTNGQVRITQFSVTYVATSGTTEPDPTPDPEEPVVPEVPENLGAKTIAEFLELKNTTDTCVLTGVVANIANTTYGNFDLVDATGSVYVYGLLTAAGESKQFASMDIAAGDTLTVKAIYNEFNSKPQAKNAIYVSHSKLVLTVEVTSENGTVDGLVDGGKYVRGAEATLTATAAEGYEFTCWTSGEDTVSTENPYTFVVTANVALVANFNKKAEPEHTYTVAGSSATVFGEPWKADNADNDMTKQEDGTYKLEKTELTLAAGTIEFKVCQDHAWTVAYPGDNYKLTIAEDGIYTITITFNPADEVVAATATKTGDVGKIIPTIAMHGNFLGEWKDTENFTLAADEATATLTLTIAEGNYEFGVRIDGTWTSNGVAFTRENASAEIVAGSGNLTLAADVAGEYTFTWTYETKTLTVTYPALVTAIEVNVTGATSTSGEWSIDLAGSWNDQALTIKLWQDNTQGFGSYAPNAETGYYILLGAKELTPTTEGVYADNGDGTFTFTCSATEGTTQYNITVTGTSGAQEVHYETFALTNLMVTDNETFLVLYASDMNMGLEVTLGVNMDGTLMDASQIFFGGKELPILSSEPVTVTFNEELLTDVYTARVVVEHMGQQLGLELIMYAGGATSEPIAVNVIGATAAVDEATDVLKITGNWDGIAFELRINAYDPAQTLYDAPQIAEFETEEVYATSNLVTVIKTGENIDIIGEFMSPMGDIYNVYVNAIFAAGPETGVDNINTTVAPVKVIENGQIFIISNGVKYNAQGAQL